jgi:hypothetical protein
MTPDTSGEIELQANGVTKAKVTANGLQDANGNSLRGGMYRNLIINGDMRIAQRGTSVSGITLRGYYTVDRFTLGGDGTVGGGAWTQSQSTDVPTGQGFASSFKMQCTTANTSLASNKHCIIAQHIEGQNCQHLKFGTSSAQSLTLSWWVKSNKTGTYILELITSNARTISKAYTINTADTWEKKTITIEGDTDASGTIDNDNTIGIQTHFWLVTGTDRSSGTLATSWQALNNPDRAVGQVNLLDSTSNYINITGVQLEVGSGASDFEFLPYDVQLQRCQRYALLLGDGLSGQARTTSSTFLCPSFYQQMRATPTVTITDTSVSISDNYAANFTSSGSTADQVDMTSFGGRISVSGFTGLTVGRSYTAFNNTNGSIMLLSAEL